MAWLSNFEETDFIDSTQIIGGKIVSIQIDKGFIGTATNPEQLKNFLFQIILYLKNGQTFEWRTTNTLENAKIILHKLLGINSQSSQSPTV